MILMAAPRPNTGKTADRSRQISFLNVPDYLHRSRVHLFVQVDITGNLLYANQLFCENYDCTSGTASFFGLLAVEDREAFITALYRSREADGEPCSLALRLPNAHTDSLPPLVWEFTLQSSEADSHVFTGLAAVPPNFCQFRRDQQTRESLISSFLTALPQPVLLINNEGIIESLFFPWQEKSHWLTKDMIGTNAAQSLPPELQSSLAKALSSAKTGADPIIDTFSLTWNNQLQHFEARFQKFNSRGIICFLRDVSEKRQARLELEEYRCQTQNLLERAPGGLFIIHEMSDGTIHIAFASSRMKQLLGLDSALELTARDIWYLIPEACRADFMAKLASARNAFTEFTFEFPFKKGEQLRWYRVQETPQRQSNGNLHWYGLLTDITQEKVMKDRLQQQADILNQVGDAVIATDLEGKIIYWNRAAEKIYGYTYEEIKDRSLFETIVGTLQQNDALAIMGDLKEGGHWQGEFPVFRKDRTSFIAHVTNRPLLDTNGVQAGMIGISFDLSQEMQRRQELSNSLAIISRQNQHLLEFTYIVSHNLRSHAANIKGLLELDAMAATQEEHREYSRLLASSAQNLLTTLEHLDELTRIQNQVNPAKEKLRLNDFVSQALHNLAFQIAESGARIVNDTPAELKISYSPAYLESILLNLLSNAIKYRATNRTLEIRITVEHSNEGYWLSVADNGLGIDLSVYKDRIFQMYQIFHDHREARGLGLFICRNQAEAMGGRIEVSSEPEAGSEFRLLLPWERDS